MLSAGPYAPVQIVAWAGMLHRYSQTDGLAQAVTDTFSGERPCEMCVKIAEAKKEDVRKSGKDQPDISLVKQAPEMAPAFAIVVPVPVSEEAPAVALLPPVDHVCAWAESPLLQPPRA